jgi:hypothetical protein
MKYFFGLLSDSALFPEANNWGRAMILEAI